MTQKYTHTRWHLYWTIAVCPSNGLEFVYFVHVYRRIYQSKRMLWHLISVLNLNIAHETKSENERVATLTKCQIFNAIWSKMQCILFYWSADNRHYLCNACVNTSEIKKTHTHTLNSGPDYYKIYIMNIHLWNINIRIIKL